MRLFKRRCSDPSPQLVSLSHIEEPRVIEPAEAVSPPETSFAAHRGVSDTNLAATASRLLPRHASDQNARTSADTTCKFSGHDSRCKMSDSEPASRDTSAERSNKKALTTWSKKVSKRWDALRRSDSSEIPTTSDICTEHRSGTLQNNLSSSSGGRRQQYSLGSASNSNDDISAQNQKRVSRVESIRNLFGRQKDGQEFRKRFDDIVNKVGVNTVLRNKRRSTPNPPAQSPSYELNEKQLLEYLLLCRPEGCNRSLDELIQNFKDTVRNNGDKSITGLNKRLGILKEENQQKSYFNNSHRHSAPVVAQAASTSTSTATPLSVDDLCAVLNGILASSNKILRPTDESGYDSDSTRTGSPRGSERGVDSPRSSPRGSTIRSQISSKRCSLEEQIFEANEMERDVESAVDDDDKRLSYNTAGKLLESMCADSTLNDSNTSTSLLEGFNCSIRTLTNNGDADESPIAYTGDTADEHSSSDEDVDCDMSTIRRRSNTTKSIQDDTVINKLEQQSSFDATFAEHLNALPSFSKIETEFTSLKTLAKTSTGLDDDHKLASSNDACRTEQEPVVRPGVVDEIVEDFENRVRSSSISSTGTIIRKGLLHSSNEKEFKCARLFVKSDEFCGLLIEKVDSNSGTNFGTSQRTGCIIIVGIEKNSPANLNGSFRINDELVKINGRRMRGLSLKDVREYLNQTGELEIVISRFKNPSTYASKIPLNSNPFQTKSCTTLFKQNRTFGDNFTTNVSFATFSNTFQNRSKSYQDQNWTLAQKTVPKIGQLYTPLALSNCTTKSFIDTDADNSSTLTWNHKINKDDDTSSRLCGGLGKCEITIKNLDNSDALFKKNLRNQPQGEENKSRNPNAPKIVGGTLKPNVNPEDVQIKKDKLNIDRSFEIESPVKKFAASPAKLGAGTSIGRRSSPAKLTGMKKFYYGHQKRRSLHAVLSPDRPQAEPIMSSQIDDSESPENASWSSHENIHEASSRTTRTLAKNFGSFQSIPEHCDTNLVGSKIYKHTENISVNSNKVKTDVVPKVISRPAELLKVQFIKGSGRPSLGFTIAGGSDSPKGSMGIYVKTVLPGGQAEKQGCLRTGDEILSVNTIPLSGLTRSQATSVFAKVRTGTVILRVLRRTAVPSSTLNPNRCPTCDNTNAFTAYGQGANTYIIDANTNNGDTDMTDLSCNSGTFLISNDACCNICCTSAFNNVDAKGDGSDDDFKMEKIGKVKRLYSAITTKF